MIFSTRTENHNSTKSVVFAITKYLPTIYFCVRRATNYSCLSSEANCTQNMILWFFDISAGKTLLLGDYLET